MSLEIGIDVDGKSPLAILKKIESETIKKWVCEISSLLGELIRELCNVSEQLLKDEQPSYEALSSINGALLDKSEINLTELSERDSVFAHDFRNMLQVICSRVEFIIHCHYNYTVEQLKLKYEQALLAMYKFLDTLNAVHENFDKIPMTLRRQFNGIALSFNSSDLSPEDIDPQDLYEVLRNLIENAVKYSPQEAREGIAVCAYVNQNGEFVFSVSNPCKEALLEDPFEIAKKNMKEGVGHGYGLTRSRELCERAGGSLSYDGATPGRVIIKGNIPCSNKHSKNNPQESHYGRKEQTVHKDGLYGDPDYARNQTYNKVTKALPKPQ